MDIARKWFPNAVLLFSVLKTRTEKRRVLELGAAQKRTHKTCDTVITYIHTMHISKTHPDVQSIEKGQPSTQRCVRSIPHGPYIHPDALQGRSKALNLRPNVDVLQASILIVQGQLGQFSRRSINFNINNWFWNVFDYNVVWKLVLRYWLNETDRSVASGGSIYLGNVIYPRTLDIGINWFSLKKNIIWNTD